MDWSHSPSFSIMNIIKKQAATTGRNKRTNMHATKLAQRRTRTLCPPPDVKAFSRPEKFCLLKAPPCHPSLPVVRSCFRSFHLLSVGRLAFALWFCLRFRPSWISLDFRTFTYLKLFPFSSFIFRTLFPPLVLRFRGFRGFRVFR